MIEMLTYLGLIFIIGLSAVAVTTVAFVLCDTLEQFIGTRYTVVLSVIALCFLVGALIGPPL